MPDGRENVAILPSFLNVVFFLETGDGCCAAFLGEIYILLRSTLSVLHGKSGIRRLAGCGLGCTNPG